MSIIWHPPLPAPDNPDDQGANQRWIIDELEEIREVLKSYGEFPRKRVLSDIIEELREEWGLT